MYEKSLYVHILNLSAPWQVKSLSLDENAASVTVGIAENTQLPKKPSHVALSGEPPLYGTLSE